MDVKNKVNSLIRWTKARSTGILGESSREWDNSIERRIIHLEDIARITEMHTGDSIDMIARL